MLFNLLTSSETPTTDNGMGSLLMMGILVIVFIAFSIFNRRSQKKRQEEAQKQLDAIRPGTKVKTIGGIMGVVVELCDDNAFILETGSEKSGKSYIKFDKQSVYQSDALEESKKEESVEEKTEEAVEEKTEESKDAE